MNVTVESSSSGASNMNVFSRFTTKLTVVILLAALIPAAVVGYVSVRVALQSQRTSAQEYYVAGAERVQERLLHRVESASSLVLSSASLLANRTIPEDAAIQTVRSLLAFAEETEALGIYDINGKVVEILAKTSQHSLPEQLSPQLLQYVRTNSTKQNLILCPPQQLSGSSVSAIPLCAVWRRQSETTKSISSPALTQDSSAVIGYVLVALENEYLCNLVATMSGTMFGGIQNRVYLTDTLLRVIAYADRLSAHNQPSMRGKGIFSAGTTQNGLQQYIGAVQEFSTPSGEPMLGVALFVPLLHTIIVVEEPQSLAYKSLTTIRNNTIFWISLSVGLAAIACVILARQFSKPVKVLAETAQKIGRQDFSVQLPETRRDEFGVLYHTLNNVSNALEKYRRLNIAEIIAERNKLETVVRQSHDGTILFDTHGTILIANSVIRQAFRIEKTIEHIPLAEIAQQHPSLALIPDVVAGLSQSSDVMRPVEIILSPHNEMKERIFRGSLVKIFAEDYLVSEDFSLEPPQENDKTPIAYLLVLRDVSREVETDKLKTELVSVVAHELRSPLNSIFGLAELIGEGILEQNEVIEYGQTIAKQSKKLADIINKFLDLSRLESGKIDIRRVPVNIEHIVRSALTTNAPLAAKKSMRVELQSEDSTALVQGDPDLLGQVIVNLLSNAVKYSAAEKSIQIEICNEPSSIRVSVKDEGYGISDTSQERLFSKFFRASDDQRVKNESGTGLGLAFVKQIIEQHGGEVGVTSRLHEGSTFWFRLPISE